MIQKILISQPTPTAAHSPYADLIAKHNLDVTFHPFIRIAPVSERKFRDQHINLSDYSAVVFGSTHAIDHYFRLCKELRFNPGEDMRYYALTEKVMLYVQKYVNMRRRRVFCSPTAKWADMATAFMKHKTGNFLVPHGGNVSAELINLLTAKNIKHTQCEVYHTVPNEFNNGTTLSDFDAIVLFTPAGVQSLVKNFPDWEQGSTQLICFGESTCQAVEATNLRLDHAPIKAQSTSIAGALDAYISEQNK